MLRTVGRLTSRVLARSLSGAPLDRGRVGDMRSDTVTLPTAQMMCQIFDSPLGDDVMGEDPTVKELEKAVAGVLEKEAAVFLPTGTMSNLVAVGAHCRRGDSLLLGDESHLWFYEQGGAAQFLSVILHPLPNNPDGTLPLTGPRSVEAAVAAGKGGYDPHCAAPRAVAIENTHNRCGGAVLPLAYVSPRKKGEGGHISPF